MTREQARNFLKNTKVFVEGKSKEIQEKLFSLGINWVIPSDTPKNCDGPYLYIEAVGDKMYIYYGLFDSVFKETEDYRRVYAEDIINLSIDSYKPFKDAKECIEEMGKHIKFGWLKSKCGDCYFITEIKSNSITIGSHTYTYPSAFDMFEFIDGSSFGITE